MVEKVDFKKDLRELILGVLGGLMFFAFCTPTFPVPSDS
jgi:hypothetical protein